MHNVTITVAELAQKLNLSEKYLLATLDFAPPLSRIANAVKVAVDDRGPGLWDADAAKRGVEILNALAAILGPHSVRDLKNMVDNCTGGEKDYEAADVLLNLALMLERNGL